MNREAAQSLAALMLYYARGDAIDMTETLRALTSVRAYLQTMA